MKEIGGYIELDRYRLPMLHEGAIHLNCGRNAVAFLLETKQISSIWFPKYMCDSCDDIFRKHHVEVHYYSVDCNFRPIGLELNNKDWLYIVNYFGQLTKNYVSKLKNNFSNIILDNAQAYFAEPIKGVDTIYTCRKFFGVPDGSFLYTDSRLNYELDFDISYKRMNFLLGRYELSASLFYNEYVANNDLFDSEPIKRMSKLTENLLHGIDYDFVKNIRTKNFSYLHHKLKNINNLELIVPEGAFMYPLFISNGANIRKKLQERKIYIPTLWPSVFNLCRKSDLEYMLAENILPLPVDQRYDLDDMKYLVEVIFECLDLEK